MKNFSRKEEWDSSYKRGDNFLYWPNEEVVRFVSKNVRKRTGVDSFFDLHNFGRNPRALDLGCGIGRHVRYLDDMRLEAYGIDFSATAVQSATEIFEAEGRHHLVERLKIGSSTNLEYSDESFDVIVSHGVLDSMRFEEARQSIKECRRVVSPDGLFYLDLISGDDSGHDADFCGEELVTGAHETGTIQSYFNFHKVLELLGEDFAPIKCELIRKENFIEAEGGGWSSRFHLVVRPS